MGKRNYLIEGVSGTGKTTVCTELQRRGYQAFHGDRELRYQDYQETDTSTDIFTSDRYKSPVWDIAKVQALIASRDEEITFFCGGSRNFSEFIELLDGVFILDVDLDTCLRRIDERVARDPSDWGGRPDEREAIVHLHQTKKNLPSSGIVIDATQPLVSVVDEILRHVRVSAL